MFILNQTQNKPLRFVFATNLLNCVDIGKRTYSCHLQLAIENKTDHRAIINSYHQTGAIILTLVMILLPTKFMDAFIRVTHYCLHILSIIFPCNVNDLSTLFIITKQMDVIEQLLNSTDHF